MPVSTVAAGLAEVAKLNFSQSEVDWLKAKLLKLCDAKITVRSQQRDELGRIKYEEVDNVGVQLAATVKAIEFGIGKPRQMIEVTNGHGSGAKPTGLADLAKMMAEQPDIAARVIRALKDGINPAQTIDVTPVDPGFVPQPPESQSEGSSSKRP